jgi:hypothetical protein
MGANTSTHRNTQQCEVVPGFVPVVLLANTSYLPQQTQFGNGSAWAYQPTPISDCHCQLHWRPHGESGFRWVVLCLPLLLCMLAARQPSCRDVGLFDNYAGAPKPPLKYAPCSTRLGPRNLCRVDLFIRVPIVFFRLFLLRLISRYEEWEYAGLVVFLTWVVSTWFILTAVAPTKPAVLTPEGALAIKNHK